MHIFAANDGNGKTTAFDPTGNDQMHQFIPRIQQEARDSACPGKRESNVIRACGSTIPAPSSRRDGTKYNLRA
jgi:hypothetical protein